MSTVDETVIGSNLQDLIQDLDAKHDELRGQLAVVSERRRRAEKALAALEGGAPAHSKPHARKAGKPSWKPRQSTVDAVVVALRQCGPDGGTRREVRGYTNLSKTAIERTIEYLRSTERVRKAGVTSTRATRYKLMNGGSNGAS